MFSFLGTVLRSGRAQRLDTPPHLPWSLLRTEGWLLQVERQKALVTANSRGPRFIRARTASREATEILCAQCPQLYCPCQVQKCALFCNICILCCSAPGKRWFWCKTDPTCLAGIFLDTISDLKRTPSEWELDFLTCRRLAPNGQAVPRGGWCQQGSRRSWAVGRCWSSLPSALQAERDFCGPFFILQKKTGKLADWTEKISLGFCLF